MRANESSIRHQHVFVLIDGSTCEVTTRSFVIITLLSWSDASWSCDDIMKYLQEGSRALYVYAKPILLPVAMRILISIVCKPWLILVAVVFSPSPFFSFWQTILRYLHPPLHRCILPGSAKARETCKMLKGETVWNGVITWYGVWCNADFFNMSLHWKRCRAFRPLNAGRGLYLFHNTRWTMLVKLVSVDFMTVWFPANFVCILGDAHGGGWGWLGRLLPTVLYIGVPE